MAGAAPLQTTNWWWKSAKYFLFWAPYAYTATEEARFILALPQQYNGAALFDAILLKMALGHATACSTTPLPTAATLSMLTCRSANHHCRQLRAHVHNKRLLMRLQQSPQSKLLEATVITILKCIEWRKLGEIIDATSDGGRWWQLIQLWDDEDIKEISDDGLEDLPLDDTVRHQIKPMFFKVDYCATW